MGVRGVEYVMKHVFIKHDSFRQLSHENSELSELLVSVGFKFSDFHDRRWVLCVEELVTRGVLWTFYTGIGAAELSLQT